MLSVFFPVSEVSATIGILHHSQSIHLPILSLACINISKGAKEPTITLHLAIHELTIVNITFGLFENRVAMKFAIRKLSNIFCSICPCKYSFAILRVIFYLSSVLVTI